MRYRTVGWPAQIMDAVSVLPASFLSVASCIVLSCGAAPIPCADNSHALQQLPNMQVSRVLCTLKCIFILRVVHAESALEEYHSSEVSHTRHFDAVMCAVSSRSAFHVLNQSICWMLTSTH
jgi:hypothetical protein